MKPLAARALQITLQAKLLKLPADLRSALSKLRPPYRRIRIEIDDDAVRMLQVVVTRTPWVHLEHTHLSQPSQCFGARKRNVRLGLARLFIRNIDRADAWRQHMVRMLLIETRLRGALRTPHQRQRPPLNMREHVRRYGPVVVC